MTTTNPDALDALTACTWLSENPDAFKCIPQSKLYAKRVEPHEKATITVSDARTRGPTPMTTDLARKEESAFLSLLIASGQIPWVCAQIERTGWEASGQRPERWWKAVGLERSKDLQPIASVDPQKPGDIDLILGTWEGRPSTDWLIGVEFKRIKFNPLGAPDRDMKRRLETAAEQAAGLQKLGFNQVLIALIVCVRLEDTDLLPRGQEGSEARRSVHRKIMQRVAREVNARISDPAVGVVGLLWDAPPDTNPRETSDMFLYKIRRPQAERPNDSTRKGLVTALQHLLPRLGLKAGDLAAVCPSCRRTVRIHASGALGCPSCSSSWDFPRLR